ncbi:MAG: hypothetical protein ACFB4I_17705 [Cyanophyceae cyanobacterium]
MTGKVLDNGVPGALILLVPLALAMVVLVTAWPFILGLLVFGLGVRFWQNYQWKQWCKQVDPFFHQLIRENRGCITPMDLSMKANLTGRAAKKFLDKKAEDYGAQRKEEEHTVYYFLTASALGSIFDDSEPLDDEELESPSQLASASAAVETLSADAPQNETEDSSDEIASEFVAADDSDRSSHSSVSETSPPARESTASAPAAEQKTEPESAAETTVETPTASESSAEEVEPEPDLAPHSDGNHTSQADNGRAVADGESELESAVLAEQEADFSGAATPDDYPPSAPMSDSDDSSLIQAELAKRLDMHSSTIGKRKSDPDFSEWSQSRDPQGIAWTYVPETKMFVPIEE